MAKLVPVTTDEQLHRLADIATAIWHECFPGIISEEQIDYMVGRFQSYDAMCRQIENENYQYFFICDGEEIAGYTGFRFEPEDKRMFLSKLYLRADQRGKGLSSAVIDMLQDICRREGLERIRLTVNIHNHQAINVYKHKGFVVAFDQKADIGSGFYMDDHVMELTVD